MQTNKTAEINDLIRIWVHIDPTTDQFMRLAGLYVLYAVLDKTGGFPRKAGVTKRTMAKGRVRSFIFQRKHQQRVLRALNAYDAVIASTDRSSVVQFARLHSVAA
jgi:hypothetical protein